MSTTWKVSAKYLKSMAGALHSLGLDGTLEGVSSQARTALQTPHAQSWWPGELLVELVARLGNDKAREVSIRASRDGMGPLVRPLASVVLALTRSPFEALLSKLSAFVGAGVQGVESRVVFKEGGAGATVSFVFPEPVPVELAAVWVGLFDVGFSLAKSGRIVSEHAEPTTHRFEVAW
ncbi:MAG: hypothetical protein GQE15_36990 [Archangiaceae bacterium]|nr:hypothetical protein [Archangiaceae bacterium]